MEVTKTSFYPLLLDILTDISESHFVAFDLELSGVPSKGAKSGKDVGRPSLQQRYVETKEAAERYQILQVGLTCVVQDPENKKYILKPYNFELSPLIDERGLDIERIFSFQSGAAEFLLKIGFDMALPFEQGVPYLSRAESKEAREKHAKRNDKSAIADIQIKPTETESLAFLERVRGEINAWLSSRVIDTHNYVNIQPMHPDHIKAEDIVPELSRFEKRLVHQLVRAEYPELVTVGKRGGVQVIRFDKEREDRIAEDRKRELHERIGRQKGFRWIIEALQGSDISNIDLRECARDPVTGESIFADMDEYKAQFHRAHSRLRGNPRIIVGHNCFLDLVYIYNTFIGSLPETVEEFQAALHELWPVVVDTKYMSTHNCGDINPVSSLDQIASQLSLQTKPVLEIDKEHMKYAAAESLHEAGYDSFLTAQIAVRLSAKLEQEGAYLEVSSDITGGDNAMKANGVANGMADGATNGITNGVDTLTLVETTAATEVFPITDDGAHSDAPPTIDGEDFVPSVEGGKWKRRGEPTLPVTNPSDPFTYDPKNLQHRHRDVERERKGFEGGMPGFGSDFWRVYGNKLRVFGTDEGVCLLDGAVGDGDLEAEDDGVGQGGVKVESLLVEV